VKVNGQVPTVGKWKPVEDDNYSSGIYSNPYIAAANNVDKQ
jgi:hypothetical protein